MIPDNSAVAFGRKLTASEWDKYGIKESDLREISRRVHREIIKRALKEGKSVPEEVLNDYQDLAKKYNKGKQ